MRKIMMLLLTVALIAFLTNSVWGDVTLRIEPKFFCWGQSIRDTITLCMDNPDDSVAAMQFDILFDTECFSVTAVEKTVRSDSMDLFSYADIQGGIRIAMTGIGHHIDPGSCAVALIIVDINYCPEDEYLWDLVGAIVAGPYGEEIVATEVDGYYYIAFCDPILSVSSTEFDLGDIWLGGMGSDTLTITNFGSLMASVYLETDGCAGADQTSFNLNVGLSKDVLITCHPDQEGPCEGVIYVEGGIGGPIEITVTCNGVIPTGTKGDVNEDGVINILDAIMAVYYMLGLIELTNPEAIWAADCNGPIGKCDGDGVVHVQDVVKIVNIILGLDECLPESVIYFNSFESDEDTTGWRWIRPEMFVDHPAPRGGRKSLYIGGGCIMPTAFFNSPPQPEEEYYTMSCWGKVEEGTGGRLYLTTSDVHNDSVTIRLTVDSPEWQFFQTEESLYCSPEDTMRIEIWIGGIIPQAMYIDLLKVEKVE